MVVSNHRAVCARFKGLLMEVTVELMWIGEYRMRASTLVFAARSPQSPPGTQSSDAWRRCGRGRRFVARGLENGRGVRLYTHTGIQFSTRCSAVATTGVPRSATNGESPLIHETTGAPRVASLRGGVVDFYSG
eukprot:scaffold38291_cov58-Phaeocystis_antarctica.AAC.4